MTPEQRQQLKPGDIVRVRDDQGQITDRIVKYEPWLLPSGHWVIGLRGIAGGYSLERVVGIATEVPIEIEIPVNLDDDEDAEEGGAS